ncbi:ScyA-related TPP-binding enzyme [Coleofasciculus sp. F4-SAH-05]|uniref:ScyA-related TPP-binding enzyme n=1 Tax=Coleofasciculus sp. F4-SAH-05 TaxID=3069525 RepID=UPI003305276D
MSVKPLNQTANSAEQLTIKTAVSANHTSVERSAGSSIFSPPTASTPNGKPSQQLEPTQLSVAQAVVKMLEDLGVRRAFGVSGGAIAPFWATLSHSSIEVIHFRHETGAAFAATEAYIANGEPVVVFTTTGPGITNALTGLMAARWEGAKVILLSASTSAPQRGRWGCQETSAYTMPISGIFTSGPLFNYATTLESDIELPQIARRLANGLARPEGFVAHISIPTGVQTSLSKVLVSRIQATQTLATLSEEAIAECVQLLSEGPFAIWVGFGARNAAKEIRKLVEKTGAGVMSSPRGKGIFPENHPQFVGVTGVGGDDSVLTYMQEQQPLRTLVLGTRLSEPTSFWSPAMVPSRGFIHVDIDPEVPGVAYPSVETFAIQSDVGLFVKVLLKQFPERINHFSPVLLPHPEREVIHPGAGCPVRPEVLLDAMQRLIVDSSNALVMAESGNSLTWGNHMLRFDTPGRYRVSTGFGSMGHFVTGVVGAALARNGKAVALVGDGAMLMNSEVSTAVKHQIPAVWIVLNDGGYNMCKQGMALLGFKGIDGDVPQADFVQIARGMGADGIRVENEFDVEAALEKAMASPVPFVVDVVIDANQPAPIGGRIKSLMSQGAKK